MAKSQKRPEEIDPSLIYNVALVMGDPGGDGHNITRTAVYRCNRPVAEVIKSHGMAVKMYDMELVEQCNDYEEGHFTEDFKEKMRAAFHNQPEILKLEYLLVESASDNKYSGYVDSSGFSKLYLEIAKLMDPDLKWREHNSSDYEVDIGGYGLFSN